MKPVKRALVGFLGFFTYRAVLFTQSLYNWVDGLDDYVVEWKRELNR